MATAAEKLRSVLWCPALSMLASPDAQEVPVRLEIYRGAETRQNSE